MPPRSAGIVGERYDGYAVVRDAKAGADVRKLVEDTNAERRKVYQDQAAAKGAPEAIAKLLVVMAVDPATRKISAFIVETGWPGVKVEHRCRFMGLRALANAAIQFTDVKVPPAPTVPPDPARSIALTLEFMSGSKSSAGAS